ncbi:MAG: hypothetical protein KatS3mg061_3458 [Dehalococcoidia bacterium]|nr:MAG: hypothetical protein KatS3mg061_3458 [Dehalococcoidia bacterium]
MTKGKRGILSNEGRPPQGLHGPSAGQGEALLVDILGVVARSNGGVARDQHHRAAGAASGGERRASLSQPRAVGHRADPRSAGCPAVAIGHGDGASLVARSEVAHPVALDQVGNQMEVAIPHHPKHHLHPFRHQGIGQGVVTQSWHAGSSSPLPASWYVSGGAGAILPLGGRAATAERDPEARVYPRGES